LARPDTVPAAAARNDVTSKKLHRTPDADQVSLPKIKSVRIDGAAHQGQAARRCARRAE
jgi:hypothetical protein